MNNDIAIKVENLTKIYHLYDKPQDRLKEALNPFKKSYHHDFYAMSDVSFEIKKGETVGIIGKNGAGKSTLLKMITGVLTPTSGDIEVNGKIASLLELGAGFNPEMTGLDNIYLNGTLMGFTKEEMDNKVDAILEFADIGEFIYQPVKMYSSGMFARLAFSIAINVEPDVLIVDEALSVGDISFQAKCMHRMTDMSESGLTLLFVSHDTHAVQSLCDQAIFIDNGSLVSLGDVDDVTSQYLTMQREKNNTLLKELTQDITTKQPTNVNIIPESDINHSLDLTGNKELEGKSSGNSKAEILDFALFNNREEETIEIISNDDYILKIAIKFNEDLDTFAVVCPIKNLQGSQEIGVSSSVENYIFPSVKKDEIYIVEIHSTMNIKYGIYNLTISIEVPIEQNEIHEFAHILDNCLTFKVIWGNLKFPTTCYTTGKLSYKKYI